MDPKTISALLRTSRDYTDKLRQNVTSLGINLTEFAILEALYQKGDLPVGDLLTKVLVNNSTLSYTISKLSKDELITRAKLSDDKRSHIITLTKKGKIKISSIAEKHYAYIHSIGNHLTATEEETLRTLLKKLNKGETNT